MNVTSTAWLLLQLAVVIAVGVSYTRPHIVARERPVTLLLTSIALICFGPAHATRMAAGWYSSENQPLAIAILFAYAGSGFAIATRYRHRRASEKARAPAGM